MVERINLLMVLDPLLSAYVVVTYSRHQEVDQLIALSQLRPLVRG